MSVQWPDVLRALGRDQVRSYAIGRLKERGFTPALFADPSGAGPTRRAVLEALIQTEDWLELNRPKAPEREPLKALRRKLERECYP